MNKPKVCLVTASRLSTGGVESHLLSLISTLSDSVDFILIGDCAPDFVQKISIYQVKLVSWRVKNTLDFLSLLPMINTICKEKPDVVHIHDARAGFLLRPILSVLRVPLLYTVHLPPYYFQFNDKLAKLKTWLYQNIEKLWNHIFTSKVIYVSESVYSEAIKKKIAPKKSAVLIPTGIKIKKFDNLDLEKLKQYREKLRSSVDGLVIINVARHHAEKNVSFILEVASELVTIEDKIEFWLVGDGPETEVLKALVDSLNLVKYVKILGNQTDIPYLLALSDIFILTSYYEGGRSIAIQEAQAAGKPCIVSSVGDNQVLIDHKKNGWLFESANKEACLKGAEYMITHPKEVEQWGINAKMKAKKTYDEKIHNHKILQLYECFA